MAWYDEFTLPSDIGNTDWIARTGPATNPGAAYATAIGGGLLKGMATGLQARHLRDDENRKQAAEDLKTALDAGDADGAVEAARRLHGDSFTPEMEASVRRQAQATANDAALKRAVETTQARDLGIEPGTLPKDFASKTPAEQRAYFQRQHLGDQFDALQKTAGLPVGAALAPVPPLPPPTGVKGAGPFTPLAPRLAPPVDSAKSAQQRDALLVALDQNPALSQQLLGGGLQQMVHGRVISLKDAQLVADKARAPIEAAKKSLAEPLLPSEQAMIGAQEIPGAPGYYLSGSGGPDHAEAVSELESAAKTYGSDLPPDYRDWPTSRLQDRIKFLHQTHPTGLATRAPNDQKTALRTLYQSMPAEIQAKYRDLIDQTAPSSDMDEATMRDYRNDLQTAYREFLQDHHFQTTLDYRKAHDAVRDGITQTMLGYRGQTLSLELNKFNAELPLLDLRTKEALQTLQSHPERWDQTDQNKLRQLEGERKTIADNYGDTTAVDAKISQVYVDAATHIAGRKTVNPPPRGRTAGPPAGGRRLGGTPHTPTGVAPPGSKGRNVIQNPSTGIMTFGAQNGH